MSLRTRLAALSVALSVAGAALLAALLLAAQWRTSRDSMAQQARTVLEVLAIQARGDLASGRIEQLDQTVSRMLEHNPEQLDVRFVAVMDANRRVLAHTKPAAYGDVADDPFSVAAAASPEPTTAEAVLDGETLLLASMPVQTAVRAGEGIRWGTVVAGIGMARIRGEIARAATLTLGGMLLILLLTGLATYVVLLRALVRPVQALTDTARRLARGDLQARAPAQRNDELAVLGSTFNDMADRLERYTRGLEEDIRVRTGELEEANRQLSEANARLQGLATTDGLTGLFNYRHFTASLASELQRCRRLHNPVSMLMLDVDHFKHFNDTQGHPAGDEVLREIARHVQSRLRRTDIPCRYGGEEFAVILVDTSKEDATLVAETLRDLVERSRFPGEEEQPGGRLTVSLGVATFPDDATDADSLVKASDAALYRAKQAGRNRVIGAPQALAAFQPDLPLEP